MEKRADGVHVSRGRYQPEVLITAGGPNTRGDKRVVSREREREEKGMGRFPPKNGTGCLTVAL